MFQELRKLWRDTIEHGGGHCPVCERWGKIYKRNINKTMAVSLIWLCKQESKDGWIDVPATAPKWLVASNQLSTLKWWGLVERGEPEENNQKKFSGLWKPTQKGFNFIHEIISIPKSVFTYNDSVEGFSEEEVFIKDCFEDYFDYQEVMKNQFSSAMLKGKK